MKKKKLVVVFAMLLVVALGQLCVYAALPSSDTEKESTEVTPKEGSGTLDPAEIVCNGGVWGKCHKIAELRMSWWYVYYYCEFSGKQEDSCPFTIYAGN
ncbi:MAG: hypothetical protein IJ909_03470 [Fibrobacter sp.]|nr:hypothetical protein [Fibrobacter sp.]MBR6183126.1 hypothetical protein [Bacteroidales bacterium]